MTRRGFLCRVPGARTIRAFLQRDQELAQLGVWIPRSVATIWNILRQQGLILDPPQRRRTRLSATQATGGDPNGFEGCFRSAKRRR
ncbi:hypothetical protein [Thermosporothrix hazakensis]|uniref:hypothetical protein n=1 Tax=Thermosporothrix hazakensis TaxID=644383 RepID=UPI0010F66C22|nr:hypothetical protein [Thermosporothrix hazakensis]